MNKEYLFRREPKKVPQVHTKNREICTEIPVPESMEIIERSLKNEPWSMNHQLYAVWDHAEDFNVYDKWGNKWIDMSSGIFVTNAGHGNPDMVKALKEMIEKPMLNSYYYYLVEQFQICSQNYQLLSNLIKLVEPYMEFWKELL